MNRKIASFFKTFILSLIILISSSQICYAQVNLGELQGALNGLITQQQVNQSSNPKTSDRVNVDETVDPVSGALILKQNDITLPGKDGMDLSIGRIYNSSSAEIGTNRTKVESSSSSWTSTQTGWMVDIIEYTISTNQYSTIRIGPCSNEADARYYFDYYSDLDRDDTFYIVNEPYFSQVITYHTNYTVTTTTFPQKYNYDRSRYDLGTGWSLSFPSVQIENEQGTEFIYFHDGSGATYKVEFTSDSSDSNLDDYQGKDVEFSKDNGTYSNGQMSSAYKFTSSDKRTTYFASDGRLLGIKDRFGNEIKFSHIDRTIYTNSSIVRSTTFPFISTIVDSIGRTIQFQYENSINNPTGFDGDTITITVNDPSNTKKLNLTYIKDRTKITATDNYGNVIDSFYEPELKYVQDPRGLWTEYVDYDQITGVQSQLKFLYDSKNLSSPAANMAYLLGAVKYTNSASFYTYSKTTRNLGPDGAIEAYRVNSRYDQQWKYTSAWNLTGDINHVNYSYGGDCTGYPTYKYEDLMPASYEFWSQSVMSNGQTQKHVFNGKKQEIRVETTALNNEKKIITNEQFATNYIYKPTRIRSDEYASDGSLATTKYVDQSYYDWGGIFTRTQPLTLAQLNDSAKKTNYTETYEYEPTYKFITKKQWYQNENKLLSENYTYDTLGRIKTFINAKGETTNYNYSTDASDPKVNIIEVSMNTENTKPTKTVTKFGAASKYAFPTVVEDYYTDENGNYVKTTTNKTYNMLLGVVESETNNQGRITSYVYDNMGRLLLVKLPDFTDQNNKTYSVQQEISYFENCTLGAVIQYFNTNLPFYGDQIKDFVDTDNQGLCSTVTYSVTDYIDKAANTSNLYQPTISAFDGYGNLLQKEAFDYCENKYQWIVKSRNLFDNMKRPIFYYDALNNSMTYSYDTWGNLAETLDSFNNLYKKEYDVKNQKISSFFVGHENLANYRANPTNATYKENMVEDYLDQWGKATERRVYPDWPSTSNYLSEIYGYDIAGNMIKYTDSKRNLNEDGYTRTYEYDELGRVSKVKDALNQITEVSYSVLGDIKNISLRENATATPVSIFNKSYNELGKIINKTDPSNKQTTYQYNDLGLFKGMTDRNNSTYSYGYDQLNNMTSNKAVKSDNTQSNEYKYNYNSPLGVSTVSEYTNNSLGGQMSFGYNMASDIMEKVFQYSSGGYNSNLSNTYDKGNKLVNSTIGNASSTNFYTNYEYSNTRLSRVQTNGAQTADATGQAYAVYDYYSDGKVKKITYPKLNDGTYLTTTYVYNKLNRLESVTNQKGSTVISQFSYTYDANGNIATINDGSITTTYVNDKLNRLAEIQKPGYLSIKYTYDIRGNRKISVANDLIFDAVNTSYSYDLRDRLTSVTKGGTTTNLNYRADGLRYSKTTPTKTVQYHYNLAGKVIAESDATGTITADYVWGPDRALVKKDSTGGEYYYLYNGHGDVVQIVDRSGNVVNNYKYDEWGNILSKNETISNPFKYSGEILDDETGLYYLRARYYDPTIGRFLNEDSVEGTVTNPLTLNVYSYVNNNPMMYVDPTGNISWRQYTTLFGGILDGLTGFSGLKSLFSWSTIQAIVQFGNAIIHGHLNYFVDVVKSVGASFVEPFEYLAEHSKNVWAGKPTDQEVAEYGRSMGSVIQTIVGAVGGGGILGEKIVAQLGKICPKLLKVVDKIEEVGETVHGNSKLSKKIQHGYEIFEKDTDDVVKTGISGQSLNKNGTSPRANSQVNKLNKQAGYDKYDSRVVETNIPDRQAALDWEESNSMRLWEDRNSMSMHQRPRPWE